MERTLRGGYSSMSRIKGPHWTLAAGVVLAAVLLTLDVRATPSHGVAQNAGATPYPPAATATAGPTQTSPPSATAPSTTAAPSTTTPPPISATLALTAA